MTSGYDTGRLPPRRPVTSADDGLGRHAGPPLAGPGVSGVIAVALLVVATTVGGLVDVSTGTGLRTTYGLGFVLGCVVAAIAVRMQDWLWAVFAPSLVFSTVAVVGAIAQSRDLERQVVSLDTASEVFLRLIDPGKAPYLLAGFALALALVLSRMALVRK